ncbi:hypothetical protein BGX27_004435 [Mortierella sp. AM989]|nr:hypothetical protein BGX27_004435 [Mortierella sp. AM989]
MGPMSLTVALMTIGSLYIASWGQVDARPDSSSTQAHWDGPSDQVGDMLAGSLEYSWSSTGTHPSGVKQHQFSEASTSGKVRFASLESAFDTYAASNRLETISTKKVYPFQEADGEMYNCMIHVDAAVDTSLGLLDEMTKVINSSPDLAQILSPLSKIIVMPSQDDDHPTIAAAMRSLEMGLTGFHYIMQYIPEQVTQSHLSNVISQAELLRQQAGEIVDCEESASFFNLASFKSRPSCQAVQVFYDDYLTQAKAKIEVQMAINAANKPLLESILTSLQFQTAGAYLTHQGAQEAVKQFGESSPSDETRSLVESTKLAIGAGDALQACQASVQKSVIQQEASSTSVSGFEHLIYSHLGMSMKRKDPTLGVDSLEASAILDDDNYSGCQNLLDEAIEAVKSARENIDVLKSETVSKIIGTIISRFVRMMDERLQRSLEDNPNVELQQMEMEMAILVRIVKDLPSWGAYGLMKKFLNPLWQLEGGLHRLYSCVLAKTPSKLMSKPDDSDDFSSDDDLTHASQDALHCDVLAESYRDSLSQSLKRLASVSKKSAEDEDTVAFLQESIQDLAEAADVWDEIDNSSMENETEVSRQAAFRAISVRAQTAQSKSIRELSELMPFMIAQANSLEACSSVWRATHGVRREAYGDENPDDNDNNESDEEY